MPKKSKTPLLFEFRELREMLRQLDATRDADAEGLSEANRRLLGIVSALHAGHESVAKLLVIAIERLEVLGDQTFADRLVDSLAAARAKVSDDLQALRARNR